MSNHVFKGEAPCSGMDCLFLKLCHQTYMEEDTQNYPPTVMFLRTPCIKGKMAILVKFFISYLTNYFLYSNYLMALITSVDGSVLRLLLFFSKYILWRNYPQLQILNKRLRHITKALVALEIKVENFIIFLSFTNGNTSIS